MSIIKKVSKIALENQWSGRRRKSLTKSVTSWLSKSHCNKENLKIFRTLFEPITFVMPAKCFNQLSYEATLMKVTQFVGFMCSLNNLNHTSQNISSTHHSFHRNTWAQQIDPLTSQWLHCSVVESTAPTSQRSWLKPRWRHLKVFFSGAVRRQSLRFCLNHVVYHLC